MEKLIHKDPETGEMTFSIRDMKQIFDTLHAYEETGLTPEQIDALKIDKLNLISMVEQLEQVKVERDKMESLLREHAPCVTCKHTECDWCEEPCETCRKDPSSPMWEWKGE